MFPCIRDLVTNGLDPTRFSIEDYRPSRQDITQYIAAWFKYIGISADECRNWLIEYCVDVLSRISSSSNSRIRHSTKSNVKYIFNSDVSFACGCENNFLKASCDRNCPIFVEMSRKYGERNKIESTQTYEPIFKPKPNIVKIEPRLPVKEKFRDQFEKAMKVARDNADKGVSARNILSLLNDSGFKTRTGRTWTYPTLLVELKKER